MRKLNDLQNIDMLNSEMSEVKGGGCLPATWNVQTAYAGLSCCGPYAVQYSNTGSLAGGTVSYAASNLWGSYTIKWSWGTAGCGVQTTCVPK